MPGLKVFFFGLKRGTKIWRKNFKAHFSEWQTTQNVDVDVDVNDDVNDVNDVDATVKTSTEPFIVSKILFHVLFRIVCVWIEFCQSHKNARTRSSNKSDTKVNKQSEQKLLLDLKGTKWFMEIIKMLDVFRFFKFMIRIRISTAKPLSISLLLFPSDSN